MHNPFVPFLQRFGVVILDGALATELERRGTDLEDPLWSAKTLLEAPEQIRQIHFDYFQAGADVAITASYQATFQGFSRRDIAHEEAADLMRLSVRLAQEARDQFWSDPARRSGRIRPLVAASIGSYGAFLADGSEYRGAYGLSKEELAEFHRPRMAVLASSGADLLACETIPCLAEGKALVGLLAEFPGTPAWLSFSCCDGQHVCHGERFAECIAAAAECHQVVAAGLNCTPPRYVASLLASASDSTLPLLAYPNRGETWDAQRRCWVPETGEDHFGPLAATWYAAGARLLGGCCRTTPETIQEMAAVLRPYCQ